MTEASASLWHNFLIILKKDYWIPVAILVAFILLFFFMKYFGFDLIWMWLQSEIVWSQVEAGMSSP